VPVGRFTERHEVGYDDGIGRLDPNVAQITLLVVITLDEVVSINTSSFITRHPAADYMNLHAGLQVITFMLNRY